MRNGDARRSDRRAGFGLIEAIVALAIAGLVLAAVTEIAGRTLRSWNAGFATVAAIERSDLAIDRLGADLAGLLPVHLETADDPAILFAGDERGMAFTSYGPLDRREDGIAIVEIGIEGDRDGAVLVRRLRRGRDVPLRDGDRVVLISGRLDIAFAYRDQAGQRFTRWSKPGEVPRGVIVTLSGTRAGGGLPVEVMLPIPVAIAVSCLVDVGSRVDGEEKPPEGEGRPPRPKRPNNFGEELGDPAEAGARDRARRCAIGPGAGSGGPKEQARPPGPPRQPPPGRGGQR